MIDQVATVLDQLSRREWFTGANALVFCNDVGDHFDDSALRRRFYSARSAAGLKRIRFHDRGIRSARSPSRSSRSPTVKAWATLTSPRP
jgi:hypothetical protein